MKVLIIDDNDRYAENLKSYLSERGIESIRAFTAREGLDLFSNHKNELSGIITDVTMETQTSGLWAIRKIWKSGFKGHLIMASTGFDVWGVMRFSYFFLPLFFGIEWMIPKVPLKQGKVEWYPTKARKTEIPPY